MIDDRQKSDHNSLNQSESDDAHWLENKIREQLEHVSSDENEVLEGSPILAHHSMQSEESDKLFEGFGSPFFNPPLNFNSQIENPTLPPGLGSADQGFSREHFSKNKAELQEHTFSHFSETLAAKALLKALQGEMPKHSRFSHCEPEPVKPSLKSRLKLQSAQFKPDYGAAPQEEHQNEEIWENEEDEENGEIENLENKIPSKEILGETPENKEKNETPEQLENNPYAGKMLNKREIEERRRKKAAEAEAEAAAKKPKASEVVIVHTKPTDETPQVEHKSELSHEAKSSKNTLETPKNSQNKTPKSTTKQEQTKPYLHHHENNGVAKQQSFKKEDSFKQATKHKKRLSVHQEREIVDYVEKKNPVSLPVSKPKEDIETKPKLAGVNKFNKFEYLIGNQPSASSESNDSIDENLEISEVKKGSNSPKKSESKSLIPEKDNDQQGSSKKKNKKKKNKNKTLTSNKDLDATPSNLAATSKEVKIPSDEGQEPSDEETEKQQNQEVKISSKTAKNKKKKANKKKKKNASSTQALDDNKDIIKTPESALSQISEIEQETLSQNTKKKTFREVCEDPNMFSLGLLFIPGSNFHDDLLKGMKVVSR